MTGLKEEGSLDEYKRRSDIKQLCLRVFWVKNSKEEKSNYRCIEEKE